MLGDGHPDLVGRHHDLPTFQHHHVAGGSIAEEGGAIAVSEARMQLAKTPGRCREIQAPPMLDQAADVVAALRVRPQRVGGRRQGRTWLLLPVSVLVVGREWTADRLRSSLFQIKEKDAGRAKNGIQVPIYG